MKPDVFDLMALAGLAMVFVGVWWLSPPWALITCGVLVGAFGVLASRTKVGHEAGEKY